MNEARVSSRRRLAFTTPPVSQPTATACSVCNQIHTNLSSPISWRDECCRELAITLGITEHSLVCRPCRNDIARLRNDPSHCPRWEKERISAECAVTQCKNKFFSKCYISMSDIVQCLELSGERIPSELDTAPPFANTITIWYTIHTSQPKHTAQLVVHASNETHDLAQIQKRLDYIW